MASSLFPDTSARHTPVPLSLSSPTTQSPAPSHAQPPPLTTPTNSQIEAAIQKAQMSAINSPDGRASALGRDIRTQLFVGNLPYRVRWQDLKDLFRKAGTVLRADVSLGPDNRSRGYGTVLFGTPEDAAKAVEIFNGYSWQSRTLEVRPDRSPPDFDAQQLGIPTPNAMNGYAVGPSPLHAIPYIPAQMLNAKLDGMSPSLDYDPMPSPMGTIFANLQTQDRSRISSASGRTLFVGNLPFHCQWQDLKDLFRQAGSVIRADVALGPDGRSRGHGTVSFSNDADADSALKMFNGYEFNGRQLKVHYDKYTGQNTPGTTASPAPGMPPLGGMPFMYSALPTYLAPASHPMSPLSVSAFDAHQNSGTASMPHSPFEVYSPASSLHPTQSSPQTKTDVPRSPRNLHIEIKDTTPTKQPHPAHPGTITLPPPTHGFPPPLSPQSTNVPPITPSMPSFSFAPQAQPTPPLHAHFLSPGIGPFSPTMSPGGFFAGPLHPPSGLNPAPGAPVRFPVGMQMVAHPHSPVSAHPPGSPGFYVPAFYTPTGPGSPGAVAVAGHEGYFPPVFAAPAPPPPQSGTQRSHPLAQEHTPPSDDSRTVSNYGYVAAYPAFTPLPPPPPQTDSSQDASPASTAEEIGAFSSPGTSLTSSEIDQPTSAKRIAVGDRSTSDSKRAAPNLTLNLNPNPNNNASSRSNSAGNHAAFSSREMQQQWQQQQPYVSSALAITPPTLEAFDGLKISGGGSAAPRDRRKSWCVESPSVEGPRGAGASYFANMVS